MRTNKSSNKFLYDFISLLYVYVEFINVGVVKEKRFKQIQELVDARVVRNKGYCDKNECIETAYSFVKKLLAI